MLSGFMARNYDVLTGFSECLVASWLGIMIVFEMARNYDVLTGFCGSLVASWLGIMMF
jgi:hypothetical protein